MSKKMFIDFAAVKAAITMEQVLDHYGVRANMHAIRDGDGLEGRCPIHQGTNPTQFKVSLSKNCWNCFGDCKCGGNVLDFIARMENTDVYSAAFKANEWFSLGLEEQARRPDERRAAIAASRESATGAATAASTPPHQPPHPPATATAAGP